MTPPIAWLPGRFLSRLVQCGFRNVPGCSKAAALAYADAGAGRSLVLLRVVTHTQFIDSGWFINNLPPQNTSSFADTSLSSTRGMRRYNRLSQQGRMNTAAQCRVSQPVSCFALSWFSLCYHFGVQARCVVFVLLMVFPRVRQQRFRTPACVLPLAFLFRGPSVQVWLSGDISFHGGERWWLSHYGRSSIFSATLL